MLMAMLVLSHAILSVIILSSIKKYNLQMNFLYLMINQKSHILLVKRKIIKSPLILTDGWSTISVFFFMKRYIFFVNCTRNHTITNKNIFISFKGQSWWQRGGRDDRISILHHHKVTQPIVYTWNQCSYVYHWFHGDNERLGRPAVGTRHIDWKTGIVIFFFYHWYSYLRRRFMLFFGFSFTAC